MSKFFAYLAGGLSALCANLHAFGFIPEPFIQTAIGVCGILVMVGVISAANSGPSSNDPEPPSGGIFNMLVLLVLGLSVSACSAGQIQTVQPRVQAFLTKADTVLVLGCTKVPQVEATLSTIQEFLPPGTTTEAIKGGVVIAETVTNALCEKITKP